MKNLITLIIFLGLSVSSAMAADDLAIQRYVSAHIKMLQAQVAQIYVSLDILNTENLSDKDKFERIGEPGFVAIDKALAESGYTAKTFYQYASDNSAAITTWLGNNSTEAFQLDSLKSERDNLMSQYEALMNTGN